MFWKTFTARLLGLWLLVLPLMFSGSPKPMGGSPSTSEFVAKGLDFHFCAHLEAFQVESDSPFIFSSSVAANVVELLIRIEIFAFDGIIFRIHNDRRAVEADVRAMATVRAVAQNLNFESAKDSQAHL